MSIAIAILCPCKDIDTTEDICSRPFKVDSGLAVPSPLRLCLLQILMNLLEGGGDLRADGVDGILKVADGVVVLIEGTVKLLVDVLDAFDLPLDVASNLPQDARGEARHAIC
eukprot:CAMPEP_0206498006 /NCGR_PEP_ID=MMETSP0324_2-20121206/50644_1 /ASSEMBLY_ACC=CAM_ASM_000836 /TAXON_ID=2866 /ORGANISM="Crypthecodinium cohnii, Strain Seligo" /LENGTH=111 /DNA_ID=CAMNT_0053983925 /DNA_START=11 /DNA_END=346 /DNA_ORIENTATION=-